jgi:antitoxin YefM
MLVKRKNGEDVVIVSRVDFESLEETNYLLSSAKNAARLYKALKAKKKDRIQFSTTAELKNEIRNRAKRS